MKILQVIFILFVITFSSCVSTGMYTSLYDSDFIFRTGGYSDIPAIVFSPDGDHIAVGSAGEALMFNVSTGAKEKIFTSEGYSYVPPGYMSSSACKDYPDKIRLIWYQYITLA